MAALTKQWMAVYTYSRHEFKVADRLEKKGIEVFCPSKTVLRQWSDRKKKIKLPLLPSYIFVNINTNEREVIYRDSGVKNFVFYQGRPAIIRDSEIEVLKVIECEDGRAVFFSKHVVIGDFIKLHEGPFKGVYGKVDKVNNNSITILVEELSCCITIIAHNLFIEH